MSQTKTLFLELISSVVGLVFCFVSMVTPGFIVDEENMMRSIFYARTCVFDKCSTRSYLALDDEKNNNGALQLSMIDVQIESLLAVVLGGVGWLILLFNAKKKVSFPSMFVTGGILLLMAGTFEFAVLLRFIAMDASTKAAEGEDNYSSISVPYSLIFAGFGIVCILFAVVRIIIRYNRNQGLAMKDEQKTNKPEDNFAENRI